MSNTDEHQPAAGPVPAPHAVTAGPPQDRRCGSPSRRLRDRRRRDGRRAAGRAVTFVALAPAPITAMQDWSPVAVKGQVAEIFGNKFVIQDDSGRALVETGRQGEGGELVAKSETVTVQGRFEHGFIHAVAIRTPTDTTTSWHRPARPRPRAPMAPTRPGGLTAAGRHAPARRRPTRRREADPSGPPSRPAFDRRQTEPDIGQALTTSRT